ncbi:hypothetical protein SAMN05192533_10879 [Mesobacillus persicus]|uniref:Uncharacterized protein n=1 Tax=Mesobacillus persicus TaxID=930146 RepID=A0A1H8D702_9BACI|nr:hypothetical protein [Mesobacillus persicus]SEN02297.1 hypothetical protein SAMN05192533_10879 [Mesobacillus persicus]
MGNKKNQEAWKDAKKRCQLNEADLQMAKELGLTPRSLLKNIPTPDQKWKAPVKWWVRGLYEEKFGKVLSVKATPNKWKAERKKLEKESIISVDLEGLPF